MKFHANINLFADTYKNQLEFKKHKYENKN